MDTTYSLSDIANVVRDNDGGFGGNGMWIFALLLLIFGMNGGGWGYNRNNGYANSDINTFATAAGQNELLLGQKFDALGQKVNSIGDGICSSTYELAQQLNGVQTNLGNAITGEGRAIQTQLCAINANIDNKFAAFEKSMLEQKIAEQTAQINALQTQQMFCGIPRINPYGYNLVPTQACCNNNGNI